MVKSNKRKDNRGRVLKKGETQRNSSQYMYRWTDSFGNRKNIYASSLDELRKKECEIEKEIALGISRTTITLNEQIEIYFQIKGNLAKSTMSNYQYYYGHSIRNSKIGRMRVVDIKKSDILLFYRKLSDSGYSAGTIKILQKIIRPALQLAYEDNVILRNPADGCTRDYAEDVEKKYALTFDEEKEFLDRVQSRPRMRRYYPMYAIMLKTGIRISEMVGLTWDDVDMEKKEININHQIQYLFADGETKYCAGKPKTSAGKRIIPMTESIYKLFAEQKKIWFSTNRDTDYEIDGYRNFVFVSHVTGRCMNHNSIRRMMRKIVTMNEEREIQLPNISPHILRHTACCRMAEAGCDIKVLQYLLGQTDIRTTMRVYNHVDSERVKREIGRMEKLDRLMG